MARSSRITQPLCVRCQHPRPFHGDGGPCKALGCTSCKAYVSPLAGAPAPATSVAYPYPGDTSVVVRPGQVWADNDPRRRGRQVRVDSIEDGGDTAVVTITSTDAPRYTGSGVGSVKRIKVRRFRPTQTGYVLVEDV